MNYYIGVDLGGTQTKIGLTDIEGSIVSSVFFDTPKDKDDILDAIAKNIVDVVNSAKLPWGSISGMGVGCPAPITNSCGRVEGLTNIKGFNCDIKRELAKRLGNISFPIGLINDADAATLAEHRLGAGRGYSNLVVLTLGTGVGGGIIIDNNLYTGSGGAGEFGHMIVSKGGKKCGCGGRGCLEAYASVSALIKSAKKLSRALDSSQLSNANPLNAKAVFDAYFLGDEAAIKSVQQFIYYLSIGIVNIANTLRPQAIIIGGGISALGDKLLTPIKIQCQKLDQFSNKAPFPKLLPAALKNNAGIQGAALSLCQKNDQPI